MYSYPIILLPLLIILLIILLIGMKSFAPHKGG